MTVWEGRRTGGEERGREAAEGLRKASMKLIRFSFGFFLGSFLSGKRRACAGPQQLLLPAGLRRLKSLLQCWYLQSPCAKLGVSDFQVSHESCSCSAGQLDLGWASSRGKLRHGRAQICLNARSVRGKAWGIQSCFSYVPSALRCSARLSSLFYFSSLATGSNLYFTTEEKAAGNEGFCPQLPSEAELPKGSWVLLQDPLLAFPSYVWHFAKNGIWEEDSILRCLLLSLLGIVFPFLFPTLRRLRWLWNGECLKLVMDGAV